jgi:hypothetical protein
MNWDLVGKPPKDGSIFAFGHTSSWTKNYMNEQRANVVLDFLKDKQFEFCFLEDM